MKRLWITLAAVIVLAIAAIAPAAAQDSVTIDLDEVGDSGASGTATLTSENGSTMVSIEISGGPEDGVHPVHIHDGTCEDLGGVAYPLDDIVDGVSESAADVSLDDLMAGEYAINAHLSEDEMATYVVCGNIPMADAGDDDAAEDDDEVVEEDDDAAMDDDEADDADEVVPAAGSTGGVGTETAVLMMTLLAVAALGTGFLFRRRAHQA